MDVIPVSDRFLTTSEAARELEVSEGTVRRLEERGTLTAFRVGANRSRVFNGEQVERVKRARRQASDAAGR
jgi:excisionase family DNA binding protein